MKYTLEVNINLSRERTIELLDNAENMKKWQDGLQSYEQIKGEPGKVGSKMGLNFKVGGREFQVVETIIDNNFPSEFNVEYEASGIWNSVENRFEVIDENTTKWIANHEYKMLTFMYRIFARLNPGMFKKQSLKVMNSFKRFAENA